MSVFENLVGQEHVVETIKAAVAATRTGQESQEMTHAWVFTGPPGSGRSSAAVAFAQALVCANKGCGACNECLSAKNGSHPDVEIIRTEGLSIKVEEVRELLTRVAWAPSMGGWRVVVMEDADRLTESAANALLKAIVDLAREHGLTPPQLALAFCYTKWQVASTIIGVTSVAQLEEDVKVWGAQLTAEVLAEIDAIRLVHRDPAT